VTPHPRFELEPSLREFVRRHIRCFAGRSIDDCCDPVSVIEEAALVVSLQKYIRKARAIEHRPKAIARAREIVTRDLSAWRSVDAAEDRFQFVIENIQLVHGQTLAQRARRSRIAANGFPRVAPHSVGQSDAMIAAHAHERGSRRMAPPNAVKGLAARAGATPAGTPALAPRRLLERLLPARVTINSGGVDNLFGAGAPLLATNPETRASRSRSDKLSHELLLSFRTKLQLLAAGSPAANS
jgi:hypothetical protein